MLSLLSTETRSQIVQLIDERLSERLHEHRQTNSPASPWMTVAEAAAYLRTTPAAIYKRIERGQLQSYRPEGSQILLHREDIDATGPARTPVL